MGTNRGVLDTLITVGLGANSLLAFVIAIIVIPNVALFIILIVISLVLGLAFCNILFDNFIFKPFGLRDQALARLADGVLRLSSGPQQARLHHVVTCDHVSVKESQRGS